MTNASQPADSLARRLVAEIAVHARLQPNRWVMLGDIVPKLGVSWLEAEAAAQFAAAKRASIEGALLGEFAVIGHVPLLTWEA
jgi:hypothetical protein